MTNEEFVFPTTRTRVLFAVVVLIAALLLWLLREPRLDWFLDFVARQKDLNVLKAVAVGFNLASFGMSAVISLWTLRIGQKIHREKRWPPEDFPVILRTKVERSGWVQAYSIGFYLAAVLFGLFACFSVHGAWLAIRI